MLISEPRQRNKNIFKNMKQIL